MCSTELVSSPTSDVGRHLLAVMAMVLVLGACTSGDDTPAESTSPPASGSAVQEPPTSAAGPPSTTSAPATTTSTTAPPPTYPIAVSVAFLDACVSDQESAGACHCALGSFASSGLADVMADFEAAIETSDTFPDRIEAELARCTSSSLATTDPTMIDELAMACSLGSDRLVDACRCAAERAALIVPAEALRAYVEAEVEPSLVDLVNRCLGA